MSDSRYEGQSGSQRWKYSRHGAALAAAIVEEADPTPQKPAFQQTFHRLGEIVASERGLVAVDHEGSGRRFGFSVVPPGLGVFGGSFSPTLKRWAIVGCPSGTESGAVEAAEEEVSAQLNAEWRMQSEELWTSGTRPRDNGLQDPPPPRLRRGRPRTAPGGQDGI